MSYDPTTDEGYVRFLISDTSDSDEDRIFTDAEITAAVGREGSLKLTAAQLIDIIADNEVMILKVIRTQDLNTDGAKVADALRKRAQTLREQAAGDLEGGSDAEDVAIIGYCASGPVYAELEAHRPVWLY